MAPRELPHPRQAAGLSGGQKEEKGASEQERDRRAGERAELLQECARCWGVCRPQGNGDQPEKRAARPHADSLSHSRGPDLQWFSRSLFLAPRMRRRCEGPRSRHGLSTKPPWVSPVVPSYPSRTAAPRHSPGGRPQHAPGEPALVAWPRNPV